jgi:hypothetical protein
MLRPIAIPVLLAATVLACSDDPSGPEPIQGSYELSITGAFSETARGTAWFGTDTDENEDPMFVVILGDETTRHVLLLGRAGEEQPAAGSYHIVAPGPNQTDWTVLHVVADGEDLLGMFSSTSGTLTITESSAEQLRGTIAFSAVGVVGQAADSIAGTGSFTAVPAPQGS